MKKYILGLLKYLFYKRVSFFAQVTFDSIISKKSKINRFSKVYSSSILVYSYIGPKTELVLASVGKYCSIAQNCSIGLATHTMNNISTSPIFPQKKKKPQREPFRISFSNIRFKIQRAKNRITSFLRFSNRKVHFVPWGWPAVFKKRLSIMPF